MIKLILFTIVVMHRMKGIQLQCPYIPDTMLMNQMVLAQEATNGNASSQNAGSIAPLLSNGQRTVPLCKMPPPICKKSKYRTTEGTCNNLQNPTWGAATTTYGRLMKYKYADGISKFPKSESGKPLPNTRLISSEFFKDVKRINPKYSLITQQWGQIITHDLALTAGTNQVGVAALVCCQNRSVVNSNNSMCAPIIIPPGDPIFPAGTCLEFIRTTTTKDVGCTSNHQPAEQLTTVTGYMDCSIVYGSSERQARPLRTFVGGRLKSEKRLNQKWPPQDPNVTLICNARSDNEPCYLTGDIRANQSPHLALLQIVLFREHNRIAKIFEKLNPLWNDEKIFQEARRLLIAEVQHINYHEYLPILLGFKNMVQAKLIYPGARDFINDYDPTANAAVYQEHSTAGFRHFHSLVEGCLDLLLENRRRIGSIRLSDWFDRPSVLEIDDAYNDLARGLTQEPMMSSDQYFTSEITKFLFRVNDTYGQDLRSLDIQRGRDHGLASYINARAYCGLRVPKTFLEMTDFISLENVRLLQKRYEKVGDVDLVVGGSLENIVAGTEAGPTFLCIELKQFHNTRVADRFFYESNTDKDIAFKLDQLNSIRDGASMARLLCDNTDVAYMQSNAFLRINKLNPLIPCKKLPSIDLNLWKDK